MNKGLTVLLTGVLWVFVIVLIVGYKEYILIQGTRVILKTDLVDARAMLRGDYVVLHYEISFLPLKKLGDGAHEWKRGDKIFVSLEKEGDAWIVSKTGKKRPEKGVYLQAKILRQVRGGYSVHYGIEKYFLPEGKGKTLEKLLAKGLEVEVAIGLDGRGVISRLLVEGKEF